MSDEPVEPLTPEEEAIRRQLNYQDALVEWQAREEARQAELAVMEPAANALAGATVIISKLNQCQSALPEDQQVHTRRIIHILKFSGNSLLERYNKLKVPNAAPVPPIENTEA